MYRIRRLTKSRPSPTLRDNQITAAHEAGHALLLAALDRFVVAINEDHHSFGYVTKVREGNMHTSRTFAEWDMLASLGGLAAERKLLGEQALGGGVDYADWLWQAEGYLENGIRGVFYRDAATPAKILHNNEALNRLQKEHEELLATFFESNFNVLKELADALIIRRQLDAQALTPLIRRVSLQNGFPRPVLASVHAEWRS
jgi:ATP-dependent Zn protease